jgi:uncharacterized protein YndB with AHSA1/START domain
MGFFDYRQTAGGQFKRVAAAGVYVKVPPEVDVFFAWTISTLLMRWFWAAYA